MRALPGVVIDHSQRNKMFFEQKCGVVKCQYDATNIKIRTTPTPRDINRSGLSYCVAIRFIKSVDESTARWLWLSEIKIEVIRAPS